MHKTRVTGTWFAFLLAVAVNPAAYSADLDKPSQDTQDNAGQRPVGPATVTEPLEPPIDSTSKAAAGAKDREDYQAKLKRCEGLVSAVERKECADRATKERGQM